MVDFLRSTERFSRLIRMYLIFSLMFIAFTTDPPRERLEVYWENISNNDYSSKGF